MGLSESRKKENQDAPGDSGKCRAGGGVRGRGWEAAVKREEKGGPRGGPTGQGVQTLPLIASLSIGTQNFEVGKWKSQRRSQRSAPVSC